MPVNRYKIQQDKGQYCLKGCDDGDLVDYSAYAAREAEHKRIGIAQCQAEARYLERIESLEEAVRYWSGYADVEFAIKQATARGELPQKGEK